METEKENLIADLFTKDELSLLEEDVKSLYEELKLNNVKLEVGIVNYDE